METSNPSLPRAATKAVLRWYEPRARAYAWRRGRPSPYRTLVSELMLQQTQAARVEPAFLAFVRRFPTVGALAAADRADVLRAWAGLGYNRRAVSLHRAARVVVQEHRGRVPVEVALLRRLPGVGPYSAAAVASIAGGVAVAALDVNVRRIVARVSSGADPTSADVDAIAASWVDRSDPGAWNQALMDLGREHCRAVPRCDGCPLERWCAFRLAGGAIAATTVARRQPRFDGSMRQVRGRIVGVLRERPRATTSALSVWTGVPRDRVAIALDALVRDGIVARHGRSYALASG
jgi:A/G-specific adenine glycosylase